MVTYLGLPCLDTQMLQIHNHRMGEVTGGWQLLLTTQFLPQYLGEPCGTYHLLRLHLVKRSLIVMS